MGAAATGNGSSAFEPQAADAAIPSKLPASDFTAPMSPHFDATHCRLCHRGPAAMATIHQHRGRGLKPSHMVLRGPLCRECGLVAWRRMTLETALLDWWGLPSVAVTPVALGLNSIVLVRLLRTPAAPAVAVFPVTWVQPVSDTV